jgi:MFS family permease
MSRPAARGHEVDDRLMSVLPSSQSAADARARRYALLAAGAAVLAVQLDFFTVQAAVPAMGEGLGVSTTSLQWVLSAYLLALATFLIAGGRLGDIFGRRRWLIIGATLFGAASLVGGAANEAWVLIAARVVQGVGGAILFPVALAVTSNAFQSGGVQRAVGLVLAIGAIGQAFGPLIGGVLTQDLSWRAVLWINVPAAAMVILLAWRGVRESRDETSDRSIDWVGLLIIAAATATLTFGFNQAGSWGWIDPRTLGFIALALAGLAAFVFVERREEQPLLDLKLFRIRAFSVITFGGALGVTATGIVVFYSMLYLQDVDGATAIEAGLTFLAFAIGYALGAVASGRFGGVAPWVVMSSALVLGGIGVVGLGLTLGATWSWIVLGLVAGTGLGLAFNYLNVVSQAVVPARLAGGASGTALTVLVVVQALALAVATAVYETLVDSSGTGEASAISLIFVGAGLVSCLAAGLVVVLGRTRDRAATAT